MLPQNFSSLLSQTLAISAELCRKYGVQQKLAFEEMMQRKNCSKGKTLPKTPC